MEGDFLKCNDYKNKRNKLPPVLLFKIIKMNLFGGGGDLGEFGVLR
jgi:hypothetical protein